MRRYLFGGPGQPLRDYEFEGAETRGKTEGGKVILGQGKGKVGVFVDF